MAALLTALLDAALCGMVFPAALSRWDGWLSLWAEMSTLYLLLGVPLGLLAAVLQRLGLAPRRPRLLPLCLLVLLVALLTPALRALDVAIRAPALEFAYEIDALWFGAVAGLTALVAVAAAALHGPVARLSARWEAARPRAASLLAVALWVSGAVAIQVAIRLLMRPLQWDWLPDAATLGALSLWALAALDLSRGRRLPLAGLVVVAFSLATPWLLGDAARAHADFALYFRGGTARSVAWVTRGLGDFDGDGSSATWLRGSDCDEGNPRVGPGLREIPGDGIDQDCRGGDAPARAASGEKRRDPVGALGHEPRCAPVPGPLSVLVLVVDSWRADHFTPELAPNLATLVRISQYFPHAYSPTSRTSTSVPAFFAARTVADLGAANPIVHDDFEDPPKLTEAFRAAGYRAALFTDLNIHPFCADGFEQVNAVWRDPPLPSPKSVLSAAGLLRGALEFLTSSERPAFVYAQLADVHAPYGVDGAGSRRSPAEDRGAYELGVSYADQQIGALLSLLRQAGRLERTVIAVTADHGEELMQRGRHGHTASVFEEAIRVPLAVYWPGCAPAIHQRPVVTTRLGPTLARAAGVPFERPGLFDPSPIPVVVEAPSGTDDVYYRAILSGQYKLLVDVANGGRMLFDLSRDALETNNLYGRTSARTITAEAEANYQRWLDAPARR